jgi:phosphatidylinositol alpha-1,6-mannosyltransferase
VKILVTATDAFGGHGGIALYTRNLLRALSTHHRRPQVFAFPRVMPLAPESIPENLTWDVSALGGKGRYVAAVSRAAVARGPFDLVLCTHLHLLPVAYSVACLHRAPLVLFVYGIEVSHPTSNMLTNHLASRIDAVVSIRRHTTKNLFSWANRNRARTYLLENAIDLSRYGMGAKDPALLERFGLKGKRVILTLGRMAEPYVGVDETLRALPSVATELPDVVYLIAGDGPDLPRLRERVRSIGMEDRVVFAGFVPDGRKADYYRLADAYAMPGSGKNFDRYPLRFVFLEAMACGVPVVGARPEDPEEREADGALLSHQVDPFNVDEIARGIIGALSLSKTIPPGLRRFEFASFEGRLHKIIDDVLTARGPSVSDKRDGVI